MRCASALHPLELSQGICICPGLGFETSHLLQPALFLSNRPNTIHFAKLRLLKPCLIELNARNRHGFHAN
eukprot:m.47359 g.47359  ORF g.47359 m.47359 type:complete len:70 (-) comp13218_c0_seq1:1414-1623(-)